MDVKEAISVRKSIRKYQDKEISEDIINELLDAARRAPSARNTQSHKYFVVKGELIDKLKEKEVFKQPYIYTAPLIIVCCADPSLYNSGENYSLIDLSIASSFLVLRATELGLGSVFVGLIEREKIKEVLNISKDFILPFVIPIGYPDENPVPKPKKEMKEIIF
ncbi:nitroreductase family protein [Nanoarchaeota archaeon]